MPECVCIDKRHAHTDASVPIFAYMVIRATISFANTLCSIYFQKSWKCVFLLMLLQTNQEIARGGKIVPLIWTPRTHNKLMRQLPLSLSYSCLYFSWILISQMKRLRGPSCDCSSSSFLLNRSQSYKVKFCPNIRLNAASIIWTRGEQNKARWGPLYRSRRSF